MADDSGNDRQTAESAGSADSASPAADQDMTAPDDGAMADGGQGGHGFFDDPDGLLSVLLLATAVLLAILAIVVRKARRASA